MFYENFKISFRHDRDNNQTICEVVDTTTDRLVNTGVAKCSHRDNFCKETGRRVSLGRAVKAFSKSRRAAIWEEYRTATKTPRW